MPPPAPPKRRTAAARSAPGGARRRRHVRRAAARDGERGQHDLVAFTDTVRHFDVGAVRQPRLDHHGLRRAVRLHHIDDAISAPAASRPSPAPRARSSPAALRSPPMRSSLAAASAPPRASRAACAWPPNPAPGVRPANGVPPARGVRPAPGVRPREAPCPARAAQPCSSARTTTPLNDAARPEARRERSRARQHRRLRGIRHDALARPPGCRRSNRW